MSFTYDREGKPLTRSFDDTIMEQLAASAVFRRGYLRGSVECMLLGELNAGKSILRKYINGTLGFIALGKALGKDSKALMRMLSDSGNPTVKNFFDIVVFLQKQEGRVFTIVDKKAA